MIQKHPKTLFWAWYSRGLRFARMVKARHNLRHAADQAATTKSVGASVRNKPGKDVQLRVPLCHPRCDFAQAEYAKTAANSALSAAKVGVSSAAHQAQNVLNSSVPFLEDVLNCWSSFFFGWNSRQQAWCNESGNDSPQNPWYFSNLHTCQVQFVQFVEALRHRTRFLSPQWLRLRSCSHGRPASARANQRVLRDVQTVWWWQGWALALLVLLFSFRLTKEKS